MNDYYYIISMNTNVQIATGLSVQFTNIFVILFLVGTGVHFVLNQILEFVDYRARLAHGKEVPAELAGYIEQEKLTQTVAYENAKYFLWIPQNVLGLVLTLALVFCGYYTFMFNWLWGATQNVYLTALLFSLFAALPSLILELPFELYEEFVVEKKFGFSTMTFKLWLSDELKNIVVSLVIAVPLLCIMIALLLHASSWWWILLGAVYVAFSFGISFLYPKVIAPLFNKFTPVEDPVLKERIEKLMERTGFKADGIFMMDASKRSKHSNAYFTGVGKSKRIVLYDTLVQQLSVEEIEAVLGHELGHYKKHHVIKRMCFMIPLIFVALFAASVLIKLPALYTGFGFTPDLSIVASGREVVLPYIQFIGMFLLGLVFEGYSDVSDLIGNAASRRDEFAADHFAAELCGSGKPLTTALIKLNKENLSELTPPKIYSIFNYNHPPLLERIRAVSDVGTGSAT